MDFAADLVSIWYLEYKDGSPDLGVIRSSRPETSRLFLRSSNELYEASTRPTLTPENSCFTRAVVCKLDAPKFRLIKPTSSPELNNHADVARQCGNDTESEPLRSRKSFRTNTVQFISDQSEVGGMTATSPLRLQISNLDVGQNERSMRHD